MQLNNWIHHLFLFFFVFFCINFWGQKQAQDFNFVSVKEGISKVGIYSITQDDYGFIWIGTNGSGLYKFDGIDYTSYKFKQLDATSISSNLVFSSYLGKNNDFWVGTEDGLNLYDRDLDQFKKIEVGQLEGANISVLSINEHKGNLYVGTRQYGLFKLNLKNRKTTRIPSEDGRNPAINNIQVNKEGVLFLGTSLGLRELDTINSKIVTPKILESISDVDLDTPIQSMLIDAENNLWVGTYSKGIFKYNFQDNNIVGFSKFSITKKRILSLVQVADSTLLIGSENDGLFHLNSDGSLIKRYLYNKTDQNSIRSNSIWSLFIDDNERIWMGYYNNGVAVSDQLFDKFNNIESLANNTNSLQTGSVTGIAKDSSNQLWITMDGGGIDILNTKTSNFNHISISNNKLYSGLTSNYIQTIFIDSKETIWAGSWDNGIYFLKKGEKKFTNINIQNSNGTLLSNAILTFDEDKDGIIWIGTFYTGVYSYDITTNTLTHHNSQDFLKHNLTTSDVRKILVDKDNSIWIGTTSGLFKIDKIGVIPLPAANK